MADQQRRFFACERCGAVRLLPSGENNRPCNAAQVTTNIWGQTTLCGGVLKPLDAQPLAPWHLSVPWPQGEQG